MLLPSTLTAWLCSSQLYAPAQLQLGSLCASTIAAPHGFASSPVAEQFGTGSSFTPLLPPAIPLAVKSPYVNAWLPAGGEHGSKGYLAGSWARHWPISYPPTDKQYELGWAGLIRIDDETFEFLGDPLSDDIGTKLIANQTAFEYTATRSTFSFEAHGVAFKVIFLSPVTPHDYVRTSLPLSFLSVEVDPKFLKKHRISVYTDINGGWATGDADADLTWDYTVHAASGIHEISRARQLRFAEIDQQAEWGRAVYATKIAHGVVASSGKASNLRSYFVKKGHLDGRQDVNYRSTKDREPVFAYSVQLSGASPSAVFTIGHMRAPYVNYVTPEGQVDRDGYWTTRFHSSHDAISYWVKNYDHAIEDAVAFDKKLRKDAVAASGENYAAIVELSTRQAFATFEITVGKTKDDVMAFLKEISSNGDMGTVDVIFPLYPILQYTNPRLIKLLLEPIITYTASGLYPNRWTVHDLGTYPNATGYNDGNDEPMPVEEAGNMLWMILAYWQMTKDTEWVDKYYDILTQWTTYLIEDGLIPAEQLSTDDFAGTLSNQTNLAVKAIVGIGAMGQLAKATGRWTQYIHYEGTAKAYVQEWYQLALTAHDYKYPHAKLAYQDEWSSGLLYNLFGDRILNLNLFDRQLYEWQSAWYHTRKEEYGIPLDTRHAWTKSDWEIFAAASATDAKTRDLFIDLLVKYLKAGKVDAGFPDLYETNNANFPGRDGQDWNIEFIARPVVGGHFALLALDVANKANGVRRDPFKEGPKRKDIDGASLGHQLGFVDQSRAGKAGLSWGREY